MAKAMGISVGFAEVHTIGKLQACNLPCMVLDLKISFEQLNVDLFPLYRAVALCADTVECEVTVVSFDKFPDHVVHGELDSQSQAHRLKSCEYLSGRKFTA
jgi:hypothetical protein